MHAKARKRLIYNLWTQMIICDSMESEDNSTTTVSFRLTSDEVQRLDEVSSIDKRSRSGMLRKIVVDYLEAVEV